MKHYWEHNDCTGQVYDKAAAVSVSKKGMAAHIVNKNLKANYPHYFSRRLNLSIRKTCKILSVSNIMEQVKRIIIWFQFFGAQATFIAKMHRIICTRC